MQFGDDKILRLDICTLKGKLLLSFDSNFTFTRSSKSGNDLLVVRGVHFPIFPTGAKVKMVAYCKSGDRVSYDCEVELSIDMQLNLAIFLSAGDVLQERRRYFKIECSTKCKLTALERGGTVLEFETPFEGVITNINLGGVYLKITSENVELKVEDVAKIYLANLMGMSLHLYAKVLRVQLSPDGEIQGYGCCFVALTQQCEEIIAKYINYLQIEKRKTGG